MVDISLAVLSAAQPRLYPCHPLWAVLSMALDSFGIGALAAHGRDVAIDRS